MPAPPPRAMKPGTTAVITSTTHRREFMALNRVATGPRALQFPEVAKMFLGSKAEQRKVLAAYVNSGENLDSVEADMTNVRTHSEKFTSTRKLMTIKEMFDAGFSEIPGCIILLYLICHHIKFINPTYIHMHTVNIYIYIVLFIYLYI